MSKLRQRRKANRESGHAIIELALSIPFLLLIGFSGFELTRYISASQAAATISRELAQVAYRCAAQQATIVDCLQERRNDIAQFSNLIFPGAQTRVSVFKFLGDRLQCDTEDPASGGTITGDVAFLGASETPGFPSRFVFASGGTTGPVGTLQGGGAELPWTICMNGFMVVGEASLPYNPTHQLFTRFVETLGGRIFYDATIL